MPCVCHLWQGCCDLGSVVDGEPVQHAFPSDGLDAALAELVATLEAPLGICTLHVPLLRRRLPLLYRASMVVGNRPRMVPTARHLAKFVRRVSVGALSEDAWGLYFGFLYHLSCTPDLCPQLLEPELEVLFCGDRFLWRSPLLHALDYVKFMVRATAGGPGPAPEIPRWGWFAARLAVNLLAAADDADRARLTQALTTEKCTVEALIFVAALPLDVPRG
jgi:hypothetical protein